MVPCILFEPLKGYTNGTDRFVALKGKGNVWTICTLHDNKVVENRIFSLHELWEEIPKGQLALLKMKYL